MTRSHPIAEARTRLEANAKAAGIDLSSQRTAIVITQRGLRLATVNPNGQVGRLIRNAGSAHFEPIARPINDHIRTQLRCTFDQELRRQQGRHHNLVGQPGNFLTGEWAYRYVQQGRFAVVLEGIEPISLLKIHPKRCVV